METLSSTESARLAPGPRSRFGGGNPCSLVTFFLLLLLPLGLSAAQPKFADLPGVRATATNSTAPAAHSTARSNAALAATTQSTNTANLVQGTNTVASASTNVMDTLDDKHKLAIGDRLSFRIVEDEEDPKELSVTDSGDVEIPPYLGRFPAEGKTCKQLAFELKKELEKEYYYQATVVVAVDLMTKSRGKVYLVGPVRNPGPQDIPSDEVFTLSKAILRAGGFGDFADKKDVKVTRKDEAGNDKTFTVNVADILEKGKTEGDMTLQPGDFIYVPERSIRF